MHTITSRVLRRRNGVGLRAAGVAGTIPLLNGDVLRITPKVGKVALLHMLFKTAGIDDHLKHNDIVEAFGTSESRSPDEIIAKSFAICLAKILSSSPLFQNSTVTVRSNYSEGQIQPLTTSIALSKREENPVFSRTRKRNFDIPENRLLGAAATKAVGLMQPDASMREIAHCNRWIAKYGDMATKADLEHVDKKLRKGQYSGPRGYYDKALTLARILLGLAGIDIHGTDLSANCVLVPMPDLFERYVRKVLSDELSSLGFVVSKGGQLGNRSLYTDGSYQLIPDIMLYQHSNLVLIADAKYKKPDSKDHYQLASYMDRYQTTVGVLLCPAKSDEIEERMYRTQNNTVVWEISIPLLSVDKTAEKLATLPALAA